MNASKRRVWLVTGANSGFGRAIVEAAVAAGDGWPTKPTTNDRGGRLNVRRPGRRYTIGYRIADVPLVFDHGPMRARVTFDHDGLVAGPFLLLHDEPDPAP